MVELRKRKTPPPKPEAPARKKKTAPKESKSAAAKAKAAIAEKVSDITAKAEEVVASAPGAAKATNGAAKETSGPPKTGETISLEKLETFGGEIQTNDGEKTTLKKLIDESKAGVVLFTYPKASTPGCTKQACLFRDSYTPLTATGFSIFGLSNDSPKSNTNFKTKQNLPYPLLCDQTGTLLKAIGLRSAKGTATRGVFVIGKDGKVLAAEPGSPDGTVAVVKKLVDGMGEGDKGGAAATEDKEMADTAGEVADTAEKLDSGKA